MNNTDVLGTPTISTGDRSSSSPQDNVKRTSPAHTESRTENCENCSIKPEGDRNVNQKREDYLSWSDYFMSVAFLSAMRSKDPSSQVGACIVNEDNKIVGIGYNGMPIGCSDDEFPWCKNALSPVDNKYMYVCHAEMNAILNKIVGKLQACKIYVALFPCNECAKLIIQSGIKQVFYFSDKNWSKEECIASRKMFDASGVIYTQHVPANKKIVIDFEAINWNKDKDPQIPPTPTRIK